MPAPADRLANVLFQDTNMKFLSETESIAKKLNYKVYIAFPYKDERGVTGTIEVDPQQSSGAGGLTIMKARKLRILCCLMNVPFNTSYAQTRTDLGTAIGTL